MNINAFIGYVCLLGAFIMGVVVISLGSVMPAVEFGLFTGLVVSGAYFLQLFVEQNNGKS